jgi:hypothetical protein
VYIYITEPTQAIKKHTKPILLTIIVDSSFLPLYEAAQQVHDGYDAWSFKKISTKNHKKICSYKYNNKINHKRYSSNILTKRKSFLVIHKSKKLKTNLRKKRKDELDITT